MYEPDKYYAFRLPKIYTELAGCAAGVGIHFQLIAAELPSLTCLRRGGGGEEGGLRGRRPPAPFEPGMVEGGGLIGPSAVGGGDSGGTKGWRPAQIGRLRSLITGLPTITRRINLFHTRTHRHTHRQTQIGRPARCCCGRRRDGSEPAGGSCGPCGCAPVPVCWCAGVPVADMRGLSQRS